MAKIDLTEHEGEQVFLDMTGRPGSGGGGA